MAPRTSSSPCSCTTVGAQDPATVYAGTLAGIYRSTNGGANWRASLTAARHFRPDDSRVHSAVALAVDPQHRTTVHTITASLGSAYESLIHRSQDGGRTWPGPSQVQAQECPKHSPTNPTKRLRWRSIR